MRAISLRAFLAYLTLGLVKASQLTGEPDPSRKVTARFDFSNSQRLCVPPPCYSSVTVRWGVTTGSIEGIGTGTVASDDAYCWGATDRRWMSGLPICDTLQRYPNSCLPERAPLGYVIEGIVNDFAHRLEITSARCSITTLVLATSQVRTCLGCTRKAFSPVQSGLGGHPPAITESHLMAGVLQAATRCLSCGNRFVYLL